MKLNESCPLQARHPQPPKHAVMPGTRRLVTRLGFLGKGSALLHGLHGPVASGPNRHRSEDDRGSAQRPWGCGKRGRNLFILIWLSIQKERHIAFCHHVLWIVHRTSPESSWRWDVLVTCQGRHRTVERWQCWFKRRHC
jgi:hypothetical protein